MAKHEMNKLAKLRICDSWLLILSALMLASGIQLEILSGAEPAWVWLHVGGGIILTSFIGWHIRLHKPAKRNSPNSRSSTRHNTPGLQWPASAWILTIITGIVATGHWAHTPLHTTLGGVHGKIGFLAIVITIPHIVKNRRFYRMFSLFPR